MTIFHSTQVSEFCIEGRFLDFALKDGYKLKGLSLATAEGEFYVKLAKHLRTSFDLRLAPGTWLQVVGVKKYDPETGEVKLKAERVMAARQGVGRISPEISTEKPLVNTETKAKPAKAKATILVCQKSDCLKRGAKGVCQALEAALSDRGLEDQVTIKGTGCMKNCKAGPNLVMPDKTRYTRISGAQVPAMMDKHFPNEGVNNSQDEMFLQEAITSVARF